jgi:hypothetical protein
MKLCNDAFLARLKIGFMTLKLRPMVLGHAMLEFLHSGKKYILMIGDNICSLVPIHIYTFCQDLVSVANLMHPALCSVVAQGLL